MPDHTIPATAAALDDRASVGGGFCPLCKACADHGIAHACITQPGPIDTVLLDLPTDALEGLLARLAAHPARPLNEHGERRGVDRTWCCCGCTTPKKDDHG
ncbi:hypothetical protein [Actinomadura sp. WMMA1423]|uniref:hypothetical protein n=1 Tax=Actinomadura sp. WMMA1423 TaxID=2591108 RepID=UPI00114789CD|nr:hypothetical protein [Actinomadura sp. WMMA1423]